MEETKPTGTPVVLRDRFSIYPSTPIPALDTPSAQAFHAEDKRGSRPLFALVVKQGFPPRVNALRVLKGVEAPVVMNLVEWGTVDWPPYDGRAMVAVYARPGGPRVMSSLKTEIPKVEEGEVVRKLVVPMAQAFKEMRQRGLVHRSIRPTNMFWTTPERGSIVLGDCATAPAGLDQPSLFESIPMAMCNTAAKGPGSFADDMYAFGVTLAFLMLGRNPVAHLNDQQVIKGKIAQSSYGLLVANERLPLGVIELLRGLLCDDPHERWTLEALDMWIAGRRLSPLAPKLEKRAVRGFSFQGEDYYTCRELSVAFANNWDHAIPIVADGRLETWLTRAAEDKDRAASVGSSARIAELSADKRVANDQLLARVCMLLDPLAPIRYKGLNAMPDGLGTYLAVTLAQGGDIRTFTECLQRDVAKMWFETRTEYNPDNSAIDASVREARSFIESPALGLGLERALYYMNDSLPCLSPLVAKDYVNDLRDLLPALDRAAASADHKTWPLDRHVAAFVAAHANFDVSRQMRDITDGDKSVATLGMLNLLALMQWRLGPESVPALTAWLGNLVAPILASYKDRDLRKELEREVPRICKGGSIIELSRLLDNPETREMDRQGFRMAHLEYQQATQDISDIENDRVDRDDKAERIGRQVAAAIASMLALVVVSITALVKVF